jgi:hypothetical protein
VILTLLEKNSMVGDMDCTYSLPVDVKTGYKVKEELSLDTS